jgi:ABC-type sugar transport system ATPase subunit
MGRITLEKITKSFGAVDVLHGIDLDIGEGEFVVFVGPSGCGKSTLLRQIAGLDRPSSGEIRIDGKLVNDVPASDRGLAMVFQSYALYPHMSVRQNLAFGLENARMPKAEIDARIAEAARMLEIGDYLQRRPGQLSGGQRQRVAIGRAIVRNPTAFLLDEPLSNLDAELRISMRAELGALHQRLKTTMIYVTHDQIEAMTLADRIVVLRKGRVEQVGTPLELYNRPANRFVAGFIGAPSMNFLSGSIETVSEAGTALRLFDGQLVTIPRRAEAASAGETVAVGLRPQHTRIAREDEGGVPVTVDIVEALGSETVVHAHAPTGELVLAVLQGQHATRRGDTLRLGFDPADLHLFGKDDRRVAGV